MEVTLGLFENVVGLFSYPNMFTLSLKVILKAVPGWEVCPRLQRQSLMKFIFLYL